MPIQEIKAKEYECSHCGYKWVNRKNGKNGSMPHNCAKCKRVNWNGGDAVAIHAEENGLRRIIKGFRRLYEDQDYYNNYKPGRKDRKLVDWPVDLSEQFLSMEPRPTVAELEQVIHSSPLHRYNNGEAIHRINGMVPDPKDPRRLIRDPSVWKPMPNKPGDVKYQHNEDPDFQSDHKKWIIKEASIRQKLMIDMMKSRGIVYKPDPVYVAAYNKAKAERDKKLDEWGKSFLQQGAKADADAEKVKGDSK